MNAACRVCGWSTRDDAAAWPRRHAPAIQQTAPMHGGDVIDQIDDIENERKFSALRGPKAAWLRVPPERYIRHRRLAMMLVLSTSFRKKLFESSMPPSIRSLWT